MSAEPPTDDQHELRTLVEATARARLGGGALVWTDGGGAHRMTLGERTSVGSSPGADVTLDDRMASRLHCEIVARSDGWWVRDLGSTNGTRVAGVQCCEARIEPGMSLRVGHTTLTLEAATAATPEEVWSEPRYHGMIGRSETMRRLFAQIARVAKVSSTVLVGGETGTGKELVARALHDASPRHAGPYVVVDCGALPEHLLEAELFGHAKGAFTGAHAARNGAIADAHGGTLFLDEVGELPVSTQPKLLRFLESRAVRRVGETHARDVDVRVIAATHRDLRAMVNGGAFREDLYFRLAVVPLHVPPLADRPGDLPLLIDHFLQRVGLPSDPILVAEASARAWPGNVRELRNFVERVAALGVHDALAGTTGPARSPTPEVSLDEPLVAIRDRCIAALELEYLRRALDATGGNVMAVARMAGLHRSHVYRLMLKHGLA